MGELTERVSTEDLLTENFSKKPDELTAKNQVSVKSSQKSSDSSQKSSDSSQKSIPEHLLSKPSKTSGITPSLKELTIQKVRSPRSNYRLPYNSLEARGVRHQ